MATLQFAYASAGKTGLPLSLAKSLRRKWHVEQSTLDAVRKWSVLPDFTWLDFGHRTEAPESNSIIGVLADLQRRTADPRLIFISGAAPAGKKYGRLLASIYSTFPKPDSVQIDMVGEPDVEAAVAKLMAVRRSLAVKAIPQPAKAVTAAPTTAHPGIRVLNPDLSTARGNLSVKLVADLFGLSVSELGRLIGKEKRATVIKTPDADALQAPLRPFSEIALLRLAVPGDEHFRKWLRAPNEHMPGLPPIEWIRQGRARDVAGFVHNALTGQPS